MAAIAVLASCGERKKETPAPEDAAPVVESAPGATATAGIAFEQEEFTSFFKYYLALQEALVASESAKAGEIARKMEQIPLEGMPGVSESIGALAKSDDLGMQRSIFFVLTKAMVPQLEAHLSSGEVYRQFCPMAFENTGAFWISDSDEVLNPYFGDAMLRCGKVEKTYGAL